MSSSQHAVHENRAAPLTSLDVNAMAPDVVTVLRGAYLGAATLIMVIFAVPPLRARFLSYGARSEPPAAVKKEKASAPTVQTPFVELLDWAAGVCIPHSWFASFYVISVTCSLYWAAELICKGPAFTAVAHRSQTRSEPMTVSQVQVAWLMMLAQGGRRLYECLHLAQASQSQMWVGHWALGALFYIGTNIAIWVEGITALQTHPWGLQDMTFASPSVRTFFGILIFILASGFQHDCHGYLASLKRSKKNASSTYQMPEHPAWNLSLTPHYFAECLVYLSLAIVAAPTGQLLNRTVLCALIFVVVNLGVTASGTKEWYTRKFGVERTQNRARMIPFIY